MRHAITIPATERVMLQTWACLVCALGVIAAIAICLFALPTCCHAVPSVYVFAVYNIISNLLIIY